MFEPSLPNLLNHYSLCLNNSVCKIRIQFAVPRSLLENLSKSLFESQDGVLYPLQNSSQQFFYQAASQLIANREEQFENKKIKDNQNNSKSKKITLDQKIERELAKLLNTLQGLKAHETFGFSKINRIIGNVRILENQESQNSKVFRIDISKFHCKIEENRNSETDLYLNLFGNIPTINLPKKYEFLNINSKNDILKSKNEENVIGKNNPKQNAKEAILNNNIDSKEKLKEISRLNSELIKQYLTVGLELPEFKTAGELSEIEIRELQNEYQDWGLTNGEFFDGALFRDQFGNPMNGHPSKIFLFSFLSYSNLVF